MPPAVNTFSEAFYLTIVVTVLNNLPQILIAVGLWYQGYKNGVKIDQAAFDRSVATAATDRLEVKAEEIHALTNSQLSTVKADLRLAQQRIIHLQELIEAKVVPVAEKLEPVLDNLPDSVV